VVSKNHSLKYDAFFMGDFSPKDPLYDELPPFFWVSQVVKIHHKKENIG
jgi:hypothetical protein